MSTDAQRAEGTHRVKLAIEQAANGNEMATRYLWIIAQAARTLDDLVDRDRTVPNDKIVEVFHTLLVELNQNPFFIQNRLYLTGLQQMALNAWLDANAWANSHDPLERLYAHVLRDLLNEMLPSVAYLTGGWRHARAVSLQIRQQFKKEFRHGTL